MVATPSQVYLAVSMLDTYLQMIKRLATKHQKPSSLSCLDHFALSLLKHTLTSKVPTNTKDICSYFYESLDQGRYRCKQCGNKRKQLPALATSI
ncbi:hypothetical protein GQ600_27915 [Phytophthora cactorum]|nr:hypothetical protein GQ600_27915 [Phytophthora cactorum]